jgi:hypothetical protein
MDTFLWKIPNDCAERLVGEYARTSSPDRFLFQEGRILEGIDGTPTVIFSAQAKELARFDDLANDAMVPLISDRLASTLQQQCGSDVQFIGTRVIAGGELLPGYRILNVTHKVKAIDHDESEYTRVPGSATQRSPSRLYYAARV